MNSRTSSFTFAIAGVLTVMNMSLVVAEQSGSVHRVSDLSKKATLRVLTDCFFNTSHCACSLVDVPAGTKQCYDATGTDSRGRITCTARDCNPSYSCNCDGSQLCKLEDLKRQAIRRIDDTNFCTRTTINSTVATLVAGQPVPRPSLKGPELTAFNQTHCSCSLKTNVVGEMTCIDFDIALPGISEQCTTRACKVNPTDLVCDVEGTSLCERRIVTKNTYVNDGPIPGALGKVYCHRKTIDVEDPICVSSCPVAKVDGNVWNSMQRTSAQITMV